MHAHTKFGIPTSNNMRYALDTRILKTSVEVKFSDPKIVHDTPLSQDASTHQKCLGTKNLIAKKKKIGFLHIKIKRSPNVNKMFLQHFDNHVILLPSSWYTLNYQI